MKAALFAAAAFLFLSLGASPLCRSDNGVAKLTIDTYGKVTIAESDTGRETVSASPLFTVRAKDGSRYPSQSALLDRKTKRIVLRFAEKKGVAEFTVKKGDGAWLFTCEKLSSPVPVEQVDFGPLETPLEKYRGYFLNMMSDDDSGVVVRAASWEDETRLAGNRPSAAVTGTRVAGPWSVGVVAAPRAKLLKSLQSMTELCGVPASTAGGAWALESPTANTSYVFADIQPWTCARWIDFALQAGISVIHFHGWWQTLGHYDFRSAYFPNGEADVRETARRIREAGLKTGMHTLSSNIQVPDDPWIKNAAPYVRDFIAERSYTLAQPLSSTANDRVLIKEAPEARQGVYLTYSGNGNVLRIDDEFIRYDVIERRPPYAFAKLTRGWAGTKAAAHASGASVDWIRQRYYALYPKLGSRMLDELCAAVSRAREAIGAEMFYFDGMEGCGKRLDMDGTRYQMFAALKSSPLTECSSPTPGTWWFQSRLGTIDRPIWNMKRFVDNRVPALEEYVKSNLLKGQMGWWSPRVKDAKGPGHYWNDMEYFAAKTAAIDAVMSIEGWNAGTQEIPVDIWKQLTILGWYERLRLVKAIAPKALGLLRSNDWEYCLRQSEEDGSWRLKPMRSARFRASGSEDAKATWKFNAPGKSRAIVRVEALLSAEPNAEASGVLVSRNPLAGRMDYSDNHLKIPKDCAFVAKVVGVGGDQVLHLKVKTDRAHLGGISDHLVKLDFRGEKRVVIPIRERDETETKAYVAYGIALDTDHIESVEMEILGAGAEQVKVNGLWAVRTKDNPISSATVTVNDVALELPFELRSGEYAELEDGVWTRFDAGRVVEVKESKSPMPSFAKGDNTITFSGKAPVPARAEVTVFSVAGKGFPILRPDLDEAAKKVLAFEAMEPFFYAPEKGATKVPALKMRPGESAWLSFAITGEAVRPKIKIGNQEASFNVTLSKGDFLECRDGLNWTASDSKGSVIKKGKLPKRLSGLTGIRPVVPSAVNRQAEMTIRIVKHYD